MSKKHLTVKKLHEENLADVMALQEKIINRFNEDEQHFILHRTKEDFMHSLQGESSNMLGVFDSSTLIAQAVYALPQNHETRDMPEFKPETPNDELVIYEGILVDPEYRGSSLMKKMLDFIEEKEIDEKRKQAIIQIAIDNPASWINALHHGMSITKVDVDPSDGAKVLYLEKEIKKSEPYTPEKGKNKKYSMYLGDNIHQKIPHLFLKMQYLINNGYHGISLNKETKSLIWMQQDETPRAPISLAQLKQAKSSELR